MTRGRFITLEGIEGAGKSTVAAALLERLRAQGRRVQLTREPGGTPLAERLRELVLSPEFGPITPEAETLIMFAARRVHVDQRIRPALEGGEWVICDRYTDATRAYQGGGRGVDGAFIESLARQVHPDCWPDLTLLFDVPVEVGLARAAQRRGKPDRIEAESAAFFAKVRARYLAIAQAEPERVVVIDGTQAPGVVLERALEALAGRTGTRA